MVNPQIKRLFLPNELKELHDLLSKAPIFEEHYPNFKDWLVPAIKDCGPEGKGKRVAYGIIIGVAEEAGSVNKTIGGCILKKTQGDTVEMKSLYRDYQFDKTEGHGTLLLKKIEEHSIKRGYSRIITDVPCNRLETVWFLINKGKFKIEGKTDLYKSGDHCYIMSKELVPCYTKDRFDWEELSRWFLENIYKITIEKSSIDKEFFKHILKWDLQTIESNKNKEDILTKGLALISERSLSEEEIQIFLTDVKQNKLQVPILFIKNPSNPKKIKESNIILIDNNKIAELTKYEPYNFSKDQIAGIIVEIKPDLFSKIKDDWDNFIYFKGAPVGKYIQKDHKLFFYVGPTLNYPMGFIGGEATIIAKDFGNPEDQWTKYEKEQKIFDKKKDYDAFTEYKKEILSIVVNKFKKYDIPLNINDIKEILNKDEIDADDLGGQYLNAEIINKFHAKIGDYEHQKKINKIKESKDEEKVIEKTINHLLKFKTNEEKNSRQSFWVGKELISKPEENGRAHLCAYFSGLGAKDIFQEARAGSGESDLVIISKDGNKQIAETKIWWYDKYVMTDGIKKFEGYMEAEKQNVGYYIVFDHKKERKLPQSLLDGKLQDQDGAYLIDVGDRKKIYLIYINISK